MTSTTAAPPGATSGVAISYHSFSGRFLDGGAFTLCPERLKPESFQSMTNGNPLPLLHPAYLMAGH